MTKEQYESLPLTELKEIAKARGLKGTSIMKKADLIQLMLDKDVEQKPRKIPEKAPEQTAERTEKTAERTQERPSAPQDMSQLDSGQIAN